MRVLLLGGVLAMMVLPGVRPQSPSALDPAGKWTFATHDEDGNAIGGTMEITGEPGKYRGQITVNGMDEKMPVTDITTSDTAIVILATAPDGGAAVIKISKGPDGKLQSMWGPVKQIIPATLEKAAKLE
jgi:hypothetical protein